MVFFILFCRVVDTENMLQTSEFKKKAVQKRIEELAKQQESVKNVRVLKAEAMRKLKQGQDAFNAIRWLKENKDQFQVS